MAVEIATTEPSVITAGDTLQWTKGITNFPASQGWTLTYVLQNKLNEISFAAIAVGDNYSVNVAPTVTQSWPPGDYALAGYVTNVSGERHTVVQSQVTVVPDPAQTIPLTHAQRTLALIESAIEGRIPTGMESTAIDGVSLSKIPIPDLVRLRSYYLDYVKNEIAKDRINRGLSNPRNSFARFRRQGAALRPPFSPPYA